MATSPVHPVQVSDRVPMKQAARVRGFDGCGTTMRFKRRSGGHDARATPSFWPALADLLDLPTHPRLASECVAA